MEFVTKILNWLRANAAGVLGIVQAAIKLVKEALTLALDVISLFFPASGVQAVIMTIRQKVNAVDGWIEVVKVKLLEYLNG